MGATSVTGVGPGDSEGEYKPENTTGCCGRGTPTESTATPLRKNCAAKVKIGGNTRYKTGNSGRIRVC